VLRPGLLPRVWLHQPMGSGFGVSLEISRARALVRFPGSLQQMIGAISSLESTFYPVRKLGAYITTWLR